MRQCTSSRRSADAAGHASPLDVAPFARAPAAEGEHPYIAEELVEGATLPT